MVSPSRHDLNKLFKFSEIIRNNKPLHSSTYKSLMTCQTLPVKILKHISFYYKNFKIGGELKTCTEDSSCTIIWPKRGEIIDCIQLLLPKDPDILLGEGAFGKVFINEYGDVTKVFVNISNELIEHLINNLPIIINNLGDDLNIYKTIISYCENSQNRLAYAMKSLQPIPKIKFQNELVFKALLNIAFKKIKVMHEKGIYHCDMKIDNIMFTPYKETLKSPVNIKELLDCMNVTMQIVDFDGALTDVSQITEGYELHPTTPYFAHPWLFEKLYKLNTIEKFDRLDSIEIVRKSSIGDTKLDHEKYHNKIFNKEFDTVFNNNEKNLSCLIFSDYYNTAMSLLQKKILQTEEGIEKFEDIVCIRLNKIAMDNKLINTVGGSKNKVGGVIDKEYRNHQEDLVHYVKNNEEKLKAILLEKGLPKKELKDEILGVPVINSTDTNIIDGELKEEDIAKYLK